MKLRRESEESAPSTGSSESAATTPRENSRPATAARCSTARSGSASRPRRPARTASSVGGRPSPPSAAKEASCSAYRAFPSASATTRPASPRRAPRRRPRARAPRRRRAGRARSARRRPRELRTRQVDEQQRSVRDPLAEIVDEIEQCRLGPVDVVQEQQHGPRARERLEQAAHGPVRLAERACVRRAAESGKARRGQLAVGVATPASR